MLKLRQSFFILSLFSIPTYAHGGPSPEESFMILVIYLLPYIFGVAIVSKGKRLLFTLVGFIMYSISFGGLLTTGGINNFRIVMFLLPYILVLIAIVMRLRKNS